MKTAEQFRESAITNKIQYWNIHDCSICGYNCGYYFFSYPNNEVIYDNGCGCTRRSFHSVRTWEDVAEHYNMQTRPETIKRMNDFWKFENEDLIK